IDADAVRRKFGVDPDSIPDYLALVGDTAGGIPGLPGWGARSSAAVLARYGHLEHIPASEADWDVKVRGAGKLAGTLRISMDAALLFRDLATLRTDHDIPQSLDDLEWRGADRQAFEAMCDELGFGGIRSRPSRWRGDPPSGAASTTPI
ncbi:MAG: 5'-3' exonuclease H3TH domain-containing protein, partial [Acidimicrobiia bacterium]